MKRKTNNHYSPIHLSILIIAAIIFHIVSGVYADYKRTTTITTTTTTYSDTDTPIPPPDPRHNYINFNIDTKKTYEPNQRVNGNIIINNDYSEPLPATFYVKLYQNNKFKESYIVKVPGLLPGETIFTFDEFGIPTINRSAASQGSWTMVISQGGEDPAYSKEASFRILSSV